MILYAVKHIHQDLWLPWVKGSNSKAELADPMEQTPRLFKSYKSASQAMHSWAKGIHVAKGGWESDDDGFTWGSASYYVVDSIEITPQSHRHLEDVCVVEITMYVKEVTRGN